ncbi:MAG: putative TetR family transcriptional regulator [Acidimicrobiales bacterium]|nr:putative TetR family transcriptional regulator [Acidimicrobiales bacterium]
MLPSPNTTCREFSLSDRRLPARERRRQLLDVAVRVFAAGGYHGSSMNEVAEAAGVTKPVLYQHFRSKRALYRELVEDVGSRLEDAITKATAEAAGPRQQVEAGFLTYFAWVDGNRESFAVLFGGATRADEDFAATALRVESTIADAIAALIDVEGLDTEGRRVLAHGLVGIAESTSRHWLIHDLDLDPEVLARQAAELAWAGLRGIRR